MWYRLEIFTKGGKKVLSLETDDATMITSSLYKLRDTLERPE